MPKKVLGAKATVLSQKEINRIYWEVFLNKNPNYIPGLIETNQINRAKEIDPNYKLESGI